MMAKLRDTDAVFKLEADSNRMHAQLDQVDIIIAETGKISLNHFLALISNGHGDILFSKLIDEATETAFAADSSCHSHPATSKPTNYKDGASKPTTQPQDGALDQQISDLKSQNGQMRQELKEIKDLLTKGSDNAGPLPVTSASGTRRTRRRKAKGRVKTMVASKLQNSNSQELLSKRRSRSSDRPPSDPRTPTTNRPGANRSTKSMQN